MVPRQKAVLCSLNESISQPWLKLGYAQGERAVVRASHVPRPAKCDLGIYVGPSVWRK
jgi:hypothetical protein